jgi:hypothetical protein
MLLPIILLCVATLVLGIAGGRPFGWAAAGLALVALLVTVLGPHALR